VSREAIPPSREIAKLLRRRRQDLGLSLREVQEQTAEMGRPIPFSTLAKIEQGKVEPGVKRLHQLFALYNLPLQIASNLLDLEDMIVDLPPAEDLEALYRQGLEEWKRGDFRKAMSCLVAVRTQAPQTPETRLLRQKALLSFAIQASGMNKPRLAQQIVDELLLEGPEPSMLVNTLIQAAVCWLRSGAIEPSLAFIARAETHIGEEDYRKRAWIEHHRAQCHAVLGDLDEVFSSSDAAIALYRKADDAAGECAVHSVQIDALESAGRYSEALAIAQEGYAFAMKHGFERKALIRKLNVGRLLVSTGHAEAGLSELQEALGRAVSIGDQPSEFFAHYHLWKAHEALGHADRARLEREAACYYVRFVEEPTAEAEEVHKMQESL